MAWKRRGKPKRKLTAKPKTKTIKIRGVEFEAGLSPHDAIDAPHVLPGYKGTSAEIDKKVEKRRNKLLAAVKGKGGIKTDFARPHFTKSGSKKASLYKPTRRGRKNEHYFFYPVFEWTIVKDFSKRDVDRDTELEDEEFEILTYEPIYRYFAKADKGSKAAWSVRPPFEFDRYSSDYVIRQQLGSYLKKGLDKKQMRSLIAAAEERLNGYAVITGIKGVWRSQYSDEYAARETARNQAEVRESVRKAGPMRKPKRSRKV